MRTSTFDASRSLAVASLAGSVDVRAGRAAAARSGSTALRRRAADVLDPHRRQDLASSDVEAGVRAAVEGEARQPAARRATASRRRDGERRDAVRADVGRRRQLEQRLRHRQRHSATSCGSGSSTRALPAATAACPGGITAGGHAHRQARRADRGQRVRRSAAGRGVGRLSQPARRARAKACRSKGAAGGRGPPARSAARRRRAAARGRRRRRARRRRRGAGGALRRRRRRLARGGQRGRAAFPARREPAEGARPFGFLFRPSGVVYVVSSDGMLHVLGLPSGKDIQRRRSSCRPTRMVRRRSRWTRRSTRRRRASCGGAPNARVGDRSRQRRQAGRVVEDQRRRRRRRASRSRRTARSSPRSARAGDRRRQGERDRRARSEDAAAEGLVHAADGGVRHRPDDPPARRQGIVAAATKDGRVLLLDAASLGGANHATPLPRRSRCSAPAPPSAPTRSRRGSRPRRRARHVRGSSLPGQRAGSPRGSRAPTNGPIAAGAVVALKLIDAGGALSLEPGWVSHDLASPATPLIVNGVVFALATGAPPRDDGGRGACCTPTTARPASGCGRAARR